MRPHEMDVLAVDGRAHDGGRDVPVDVRDLDLDPTIGPVGLPGALLGQLDHPVSRRDAELLAGLSLDEVRVERILHPSRVAVEPTFEVVEDGALDRTRRLRPGIDRRH